MEEVSEFESWFNDPETIEARKAFQKRWHEATELIGNNLTPEMTSDIRMWRCEQDYTWRAVASAFYEKYTDFSEQYGIDNGNQISGMMLCEISQKLLNQETSEGWN